MKLTKTDKRKTESLLNLLLSHLHDARRAKETGYAKEHYYTAMGIIRLLSALNVTTQTEDTELWHLVNDVDNGLEISDMRVELAVIFQ